MEAVKWYDAKELMRTVPCEEMNHQNSGVDLNGAERRPRDGHGQPGERETKPSLLFRPWYVWVMNEKVYGGPVEYAV